MWELPDEELTGPRGPVPKEFDRALALWEKSRADLGESELTGPLDLRGSRKQLRASGGEQLVILAQFLGTLRHKLMILRLDRDVTAIITGTSEEVWLHAGDHIVGFLTEPVVNLDHPFLLPLRMSVRQLPNAEIYLEAIPGDIHSLYEFEIEGSY